MSEPPSKKRKVASSLVVALRESALKVPWRRPKYETFESKWLEELLELVKTEDDVKDVGWTQMAVKSFEWLDKANRALDGMLDFQGLDFKATGAIYLCSDLITSLAWWSERKSLFLHDDDEATPADKQHLFAVVKFLVAHFPREFDNQRLQALFHRACSDQCLELAQWLFPRFDLFLGPNAEYTIDDLHLEKACYSNNFEMARFIVDLYPEFRSEFDNSTAFEDVCRLGLTDMAKWLDSETKTTRQEHRNDNAFRLACLYGHLETAQWLKQRWPSIDHFQDDNRCFNYTMRFSYLEMAEWLADTFEDIVPSEGDCAALVEACEGGHLHMVKWLEERCGIPVEGLNDAFSVACKGGHEELARWLKTRWPTIDHKWDDNRAFRLACENYHPRLAVWLLELDSQ